MLEPLKPSTAGPIDQAIAPLVEMLAAALVQRRQTIGDSAAFHNLTGAIVAYGKVLGLLSGLKQLQEEPQDIGGPYDRFRLPVEMRM